MLIGFERPPGAAEEAMVREVDGVISRTFHLVPVIAASLPVPAIDALLQKPGVRYIEPDAEVYALQQAVPWGIERVFGDENYSFSTWTDSTGAGIGVAVLDSGIYLNHEDLNVVGGTSIIDDTHWGSDRMGHGTHVAGTIAALDNAWGVVGVAPEVDLYSVKVLDDEGSGSAGDLVAGIQWVTEQGVDNIRVMNMSVGTSDLTTLKDACDAAYAAGHLLVAAAGNEYEGVDTVLYPAKYSSVIAVAASTSDNQRASFSSTGSAVELIAPGVDIQSTDINLTSVVTVEGVEYESRPLEYSGTSGVTGQLVNCGLGRPEDIPEELPQDEWIALIDRGEITFEDKVRNVMEEGADAAIIVNNDEADPDRPGNFTLGDPEELWVPTVSVSYNSGLQIRANAVLGEGTVTVRFDSYPYLEGTSMASPHVAGVAALAWAANPDLTNVQIRGILQDTAEDLGLPEDHQGYGLVRADLAVALALDTEPSQPGYIFTAPPAIALGSMHPGTPAIGNSSGSVSGDNSAGYIVTGIDAKAENTGSMVSGEDVLTNKFQMGPSAEDLGDADVAQTFLNASGAGQHEVPFYVSQVVTWEDPAADNYTITITFTVIEKSE